MPHLFRAAALAALAALVMGLAACQGDARVADAGDQGPSSQLRLGYLATVTHAPALVGLANGYFEDVLGDTSLSTQVFSAGPAAVEALAAGAIDAAFIGPNPAITGFVRTNGDGLRIVSGAAAGGAELVVRPGIRTPRDLIGATLASPQLGGTQDVALRTWLAENGLRTNLRGGGEVSITPTANALALQLFQDATLDGAWVPEPWASRLLLEAGGHVLVDERDLWPDGLFPTNYLVVSAIFLTEHPATVRALITGTVESIAWIAANPEEAADEVNRSLDILTGAPLTADALDRAFTNVTFTPDPIAFVLQELRDRAVAVGTTPDVSVDGIFDLELLNAVLAERGESAVPDAGLGHG